MNSSPPRKGYLQYNWSSSPERDSADYEPQTCKISLSIMNSWSPPREGYLQNWSERDSPQTCCKRQKLAAAARKQVCIVCYSGRWPKASYSIIVADVDSLCNKSYLARDDDEFIPVRTAIRLKVGSADLLFCGLGSTLYAFESTPPHKSAYAIDLSPYFYYSNKKPTLIVLNNKIRDMHHPKNDPFAIPTPDAKKILVFSRLLSYEHPKLVGGDDFELYDPKTDTWQQLPGMHPDWLNSQIINSFTFIGTSTFFIETSFRQKFALNLESTDQGWQRMKTFYGARSASPLGQLGRFLVVEEHLCVSPQVAYDIHKQVGNPFGFSFPLPTIGDDIGYYKPLLVELLPSEESGKYNFCNLVAGMSLSTNIPHLSLNVTSCDLSRYKSNKDGSHQDYEELERCMTVCDPIKFCLDAAEQGPHDFYPLCFFSIDPIKTS